MLERERSVCLACKHLKKFHTERLSDLEHEHYFCSEMKEGIDSVIAKEQGINYIPCVVKCDMYEEGKNSSQV